MIFSFPSQWILSRFRARLLKEPEAPEIFEIARDLSALAGLPMPALYVIPNASPNLFSTATLTRSGSIAFTKGLVDLLNREEMQGVLAHEMVHLKSGQALAASVIAVMSAGLFSILTILRWIFSFAEKHRNPQKTSNALIILTSWILIPVVSCLIRICIPKSREFQADQKAVQWLGDPLYLASALRKIQNGMERTPHRQPDPAFEHLWIAYAGDSKTFFSRILNGHPPLEQRISKLISNR